MRRTLAALTTSIFLICAPLAARHYKRPPQTQAVSPKPDWKTVDPEAVAKLREYLRIDTTNPPGNESRGVEWYAKIFDAKGIPYQTGESAPGRGNIVARLKATSANESLPAFVLLNHIDVVPANRQYWTADPFAADERDGYIWARGASDMKSTGIAQLMAFLELHRLHTPLKRDVIFLATADEEDGTKSGARWVVEQHPEWITGAGFVVNEGAGSRADKNGKPIYFGVGAFNKTPAWLKIVATGTAGHGSVPIPESSVNRLIAALEKLRNYKPPLELTPAVERALKSAAPYEQEPWKTRLANLGTWIKDPNARAQLEKEPRYLALLTNTISITGLNGTDKINVIPPEASAQLDCRLLPGWTAERWVAELQGVIGTDHLRIEILQSHPSSPGSSLDTPLHKTIEDAVHALFPGAGVADTTSTGFNDSYYFRVKGITAYGFVPFAMKPEDSTRAHGNDERIAVTSFTDGVHLMWEVVSRFSAAN
ncbi:MAG TPA: M20/M25/M40 family metallo-hydrolase [Candidatus Acidoferrales bacterium]|nr:M20/M25/M40 family metallo-hydrolase [Candidatus Acidoferrales bacterium]